MKTSYFVFLNMHLLQRDLFSVRFAIYLDFRICFSKMSFVSLFKTDSVLQGLYHLLKVLQILRALLSAQGTLYYILLWITN